MSTPTPPGNPADSKTQVQQTVPMCLADGTATGSMQWFLESGNDASAPVFHHNNLDYFICGEAAFASIAASIKRAQKSVDIICWGFDPAMELTRDAAPQWPRGETWATCVFEATKVPPIDPEADEWFQQGMALSSGFNEPEDQNFKAAAALWEKAAERKHWKAMINLASMYANGAGHSQYTEYNPAYAVDRDEEKAVLITEEAMRLGIPAAFDLMGTFHSEGRGVKTSSDRAWAFWQLAVEMGNPSAMAYLGKSLRGTYDNPEQLKWGNHFIAIQMLECGMAQGNAKAAFELGVILDGDDKALGEDYAKALAALQSAVKFGSEKAAGYLASIFDVGDPIVGNAKDLPRAERYDTLGHAMRLNFDLRFPNLDKVLPLPPAELPKWNGDFDTLVNAASGVRPTPQPQ